jgi:hypothetical protein
MTCHLIAGRFREGFTDGPMPVDNVDSCSTYIHLLISGVSFLHLVTLISLNSLYSAPSLTSHDYLYMKDVPSQIRYTTDLFLPILLELQRCLQILAPTY